VAATITNLAGDLTLVDRMKDAIAGECARRQELLAKANAKNVWDYEKMRENGADLDPLPALFICIERVLRDADREAGLHRQSSCRSAASAGRCRCTCC